MTANAWPMPVIDMLLFSLYLSPVLVRKVSNASEVQTPPAVKIDEARQRG
jgi:hypothetical protein